MLGFIEDQDDEILGMEDNLLPKGSYRFKAMVHKNKDCGEARIKLTAVGLIPDTTCYFISKKHTIDKDQIILELHVQCADTGILVLCPSTKLEDAWLSLRLYSIAGENGRTVKKIESDGPTTRLW